MPCYINYAMKEWALLAVYMSGVINWENLLEIKYFSH